MKSLLPFFAETFGEIQERRKTASESGLLYLDGQERMLTKLVKFLGLSMNDVIREWKHKDKE